MTVEPTRLPQNYTGGERQIWIRLHDQMIKERQRPQVTSSGGSSLGGAAGPIFSGGSGGGGAGGGGGGGIGLADAVGGAVVGTVGGVAAVGSALGEQSGKLATWVLFRVGPLKALGRLGERICTAGWKPRAILALPLALVGVIIAASHGGADPAMALVGAGLGAAAGAILPTVLGLALALTAMLTGLAIGLALVAAVLGLLYLAVTAALAA